jgi:hypothetical protein
MHLLASFYLSPVGLGQQKYRIAAIEPNQDPFFRIGRCLTGFQTLKRVEFESVRVHFDTDPAWLYLKPVIARAIQQIIPSAEVITERLYFASDWVKASRKYSPSDVILLHANDDHALLDNASVRELERLANVLKEHEKNPMAAVTHFPEFSSMASSRAKGTTGPSGFRQFPVRSAVGSTLVRGDFLQSWFVEEKFGATEVIVRPDNPLGRSVRFPESQILVPNLEVMRHMDGYAHVLTHRPLAPLRNLVLFTPHNREQSFQFLSETWETGLWPQRLFGFRGSGCDLHITDPSGIDGFWSLVRVQVAIIQLYWGFRFSPRYLVWVIGRKSLGKRLLALLIGIFTFPVVRNLPDFLTTYPLVFLGKGLKRSAKRILPTIHTRPLNPEARPRGGSSFANQVGYLGVGRALLHRVMMVLTSLRKRWEV